MRPTAPVRTSGKGLGGETEWKIDKIEPDKTKVKGGDHTFIQTKFIAQKVKKAAIFYKTLPIEAMPYHQNKSGIT